MIQATYFAVLNNGKHVTKSVKVPNYDEAIKQLRKHLDENVEVSSVSKFYFSYGAEAQELSRNEVRELFEVR